MAREPSKTIRRAQWALWGGLALIGWSVAGILLTLRLRWFDEASSFVLAGLWLGTLSGLVVASIASGVITLARRREQRPKRMNRGSER